jgi:hypothetical protein
MNDTRKENNMSKEQIEAHLGIIEAQVTHFNKTRDIEWKVNISLWTLIAASFTVKSFQLESWEFYTLICLHLLWMFFIQLSENKSWDLVLELRDKLLNKEPGGHGCKCPVKCITSLFWIISPVIVTGILLWVRAHTNIT